MLYLSFPMLNLVVFHFFTEPTWGHMEREKMYVEIRALSFYVQFAFDSDQ